MEQPHFWRCAAVFSKSQHLLSKLSFHQKLLSRVDQPLGSASALISPITPQSCNFVLIIRAALSTNSPLQLFHLINTRKKDERPQRDMANVVQPGSAYLGLQKNLNFAG